VGAGLLAYQVATKTNPEPPLPWQHTCSQGAEDVLLDCRQPLLATQVIRDCSRCRVKTLRRLGPAVQALEGGVCHRGWGCNHRTIRTISVSILGIILRIAPLKIVRNRE
jgi:hypothetical protein